MNSQFSSLVIYDIANNHQGNLPHALNIVDQFKEIMPDTLSVAMKLQLRDLPSFIHPDYRDTKYGKRFLGTDMSKSCFREVAKKIKESGFFLMATPFDENSVDFAMELEVDYMKIASCSAKDFPLMEAVAKTGKPTVISTGGLNWNEIDDVVSFFEHRGVSIALHHCVSLYPTKDEDMALLRIKQIHERYPQLTVGWSTHEDPNDIETVGMAYAAGARLFEKHVGLKTELNELNDYSVTPAQAKRWQDALVRAVSKWNIKSDFVQKQQEGLQALMRGEWELNGETVLAIPFNPDAPYKSKSPMDMMGSCIHELKAMLNDARVTLPVNFEVEYSHHYGVERFRQVGTTMITVLNTENYAKKLLVQLPMQDHPEHYHPIKDETFYVLYGDLKVCANGRLKTLYAGDHITVPPGTWHSFSTINGCIFEEISTKAITGDSVYKNPSISALSNDERKTKVKGWGRFQLKKKVAT